MRVLIACEFSGTVRDAFIARGHYARSVDLLPTEKHGTVVFAGDLPVCECCGEEPWCVEHAMHYADCICLGPTEDEAEYADDCEHGARHLSGDLFGLEDLEGYDLLIAHPPCTRLANSGVRWLHVPPPDKTLEEIWADFEDGVSLYQRIRALPIARKAIENPIMHKYARERIGVGPRHVVQPWWFGERAFKATGFELIGLPPLVATNKLTPPKAGTDEHKAWSFIHRASRGPDRWKIRSRTFQGIANAMADQWGSSAMERAA
ncbi:MAG: hypothetical protein ACO1Q7_03995 [Gemmatimonas sp.]